MSAVTTTTRSRSTASEGTSAVQSVDRAITILEILASRGETGVTDIADTIGVHKSTAFRLLSVLEQRGLAEQVTERGKYRLGFRMVVLAHAAARQMDLTELCRPLCQWLADQVGETVNVALLDDDAAVNVVQVRGPKAVSSHNWIGQRTPLHATSSGKVLLADLPLERREAIYRNGLAQLTAHTISDTDRLEAQLAEVRTLGYAYTIEELEDGLSAVAAPVRSGEGRVAAAISVSAPSYRLGPEHIPEVAALVRTAADRASVELGALA